MSSTHGFLHRCCPFLTLDGPTPRYFDIDLKKKIGTYEYRTRAIISRGLYIFYPIFLVTDQTFGSAELFS